MDAKLCDVRHDQIEKTLDSHGEILSNHTGRLFQLEGGINTVSQAIENIRKVSNHMEDRIAEMEAKPRKRWDMLVNTVLQWVLLAAIATLAAKIGIS